MAKRGSTLEVLKDAGFKPKALKGANFHPDDFRKHFTAADLRKAGCKIKLMFLVSDLSFSDGNAESLNIFVIPVYIRCSRPVCSFPSEHLYIRYFCYRFLKSCPFSSPSSFQPFNIDLSNACGLGKMK